MADELDLDIFWLKDESLEDSANLAGLKRVNPACPASLDTLKVSVPPAVKLAAAIRARLALDPDIIAAEIDSQISATATLFCERNREDVLRADHRQTCNRYVQEK